MDHFFQRNNPSAYSNNRLSNNEAGEGKVFLLTVLHGLLEDGVSSYQVKAIRSRYFPEQSISSQVSIKKVHDVLTAEGLITNLYFELSECLEVWT